MGNWLLRWSCGCGKSGLQLKNACQPGERLIFTCPYCMSPVFSATFPWTEGGPADVTVARWDAGIEAIDMDRLAAAGGTDLLRKPPRGRGPAPAG